MQVLLGSFYIFFALEYAHAFPLPSWTCYNHFSILVYGFYHLCHIGALPIGLSPHQGYHSKSKTRAAFGLRLLSPIIEAYLSSLPHIWCMTKVFSFGWLIWGFVLFWVFFSYCGLWETNYSHSCVGSTGFSFPVVLSGHWVFSPHTFQHCSGEE